MNDFNGEFLSRRRWLGVGPAASGLLLAANAHAQVVADKNSGVKTYNIRDFGAGATALRLTPRPFRQPSTPAARDPRRHRPGSCRRLRNRDP